MTTTNTQTTQAAGARPANLPTHVAKVRRGKGENATYERIGVAWVNADGSMYVKLVGTQVVSSFMLYERAEGEAAGA